VEITEKYVDKIQLVTGAHIHRAEFRAPKDGSGIQVPYLITPSISPVYLNNPSYTLLEISKSSLDISMHSLQLYKYMFTGSKIWTISNPKDDFGLDLSSPETINFDFMKN
jgi:hypothetical protein